VISNLIKNGMQFGFLFMWFILWLGASSLYISVIVR